MLSAFHDLFTHFSAPSRRSIFDGAGSMFSPGLIKDMGVRTTCGARAHL